MYYISAQPDALYFKWQLEVQLLNFKQRKIPAEKIHVLIGYNPINGLHPKFIELSEEQKDKACFFFYEDTRVNRNYVSSIRPHIIKKHFSDYAYLNDECIFYHDSDIIFRELPDFERLCKGDKWYVSDTRSYLNANYIKNISEIIFHEMCELLNVDKQLILNNNDNAGGAQYVLKGVNYQFWDKVEGDCERLYKYLSDNKERYADMYHKNVGADKSVYNGLQIWCTDMWAVLWNGLDMGFNIEIDKELDFCWPADPLDRWEETKILHNSGVTESTGNKYFHKGGFHNSVPYDTAFDYVAKDKCTIKYVEAILYCMNSQRVDLSDVTFILTVRIDSQDLLDNIYITINFINKHFKTKVLLVEADKESKIEDSKLPGCVEKIFIRDENSFFHKTKYNNLMIRKADTDIISLYDADVFFDPLQIREAVCKIRSKECDIVYPYDGKIASAWDPELKYFFASKLDTRLFLNAANIDNAKAFGGAVFINKGIYIKCGMDNEIISEGEIEDIERPRRMEILGFKYARINGPLYHLSYKRALNYNHTSKNGYHTLIQEYIRICKMSKKELINEIANWQWTNANW